MKYLVLLAVVLCMTSAAQNDFYLWKDRGKEGKQFWGRNHTVMEGDNITLVCHSQPKAGRTYTWYYWHVRERQFGTQKYGESALLLKFVGWKKPKYTRNFGIMQSLIKGTRDIQLRNVGRYATGIYTCGVETLMQRKPKREYYSEYTYRKVTVQCPPKIESKMKTSAHLVGGTKLTLDCTSSGYPTPVITWSRVDGRRLPERTITHNKGLFSIHSVGQLERGEYKCVSSNIHGQDTRIFSVNVTVPAKILVIDKSYAMIGKDGLVKCVAIGIPRPSFQWKWYEGPHKRTLSSNDGVMGRFQVQDEHYFENSTSYLFIKNVQRVDLRYYVCSAQNSHVDYLSIELIAFTVPDRPLIQVLAKTSTSIALNWAIAPNDGGKPVTSVTVEYAPMNISKWQRTTVPYPGSSRHTIKNLTPSTQYTVQVRAVNEIGQSHPSVNEVTTDQVNGGVRIFSTNNKGGMEEEGVDMMVLVGGVAGGFLVLIIAIVIVCILMRNILRNSAKKAAENAERLAKTTNPDTTTALINFLQHGGDRLSTTTGSGGCVGNSGEVLQITTSNKWEFPRDRLQLQNVLGSGAFGIVMKAEAEGINGYNSGTTPVAVKFVKENESASAKKDLIAELELLKLIEPHKNVINLLGCCTRSEPLMVIVEFCAYGDLQSFLRSSRGIRDQYYLDCYKRPSSRLTSKELLMFGTQISRGMAHLACLKVIHRDLAARNILVDENKVCKVSDFGFARDIYVEDHYTRKTAGGRFPIKWMAIESLLDGISTTKSDVWSFAIVLWEIITLGASPYPGMNSQEVVSFLQNGMRMDKPKHCSDELYNLLLDCWQVAAHRRPNFEMLARYLDRMCNDDFEYINMRTYDDHLYINFDGNTLSEGSNSATLMKEDSGSKRDSEESMEAKIESN